MLHYRSVRTIQERRYPTQSEMQSAKKAGSTLRWLRRLALALRAAGSAARARRRILSTGQPLAVLAVLVIIATLAACSMREVAQKVSEELRAQPYAVLQVGGLINDHTGIPPLDSTLRRFRPYPE